MLHASGNPARETRRSIIIGGSIAGLAAGLTLTRAGFSTTIIERSSAALDERGGGLGVDSSLINEVRGRAADPNFPLIVARGRRVTFVSGGRTETWTERLAIEHSSSWGALYRALRKDYGGTHLSGVTATAIDETPDGVRVHANGQILDGDLAVVADGYYSRFRHLVAPEHPEPLYAGYILWRGLLDERMLPPEIWEIYANYQLHLCSTPLHHFVAYMIPGGDGSVLPGSRRLNWGWYYAVPARELPRLFATDDGAHTDLRTVPIGKVSRAAQQEIASVGAAIWPEPWQSVLSLTLKNDRLFAAAIYEYVPYRLVRDRIVLVGDAGHVASPITGSGARFALQDARQLGASLDGWSVSEGLADFERKRLNISRQLVLQGAAWGRRFVQESAERSKQDTSMR